MYAIYTDFKGATRVPPLTAALWLKQLTKRDSGSTANVNVW